MKKTKTYKVIVYGIYVTEGFDFNTLRKALEHAKKWIECGYSVKIETKETINGKR